MTICKTQTCKVILNYTNLRMMPDLETNTLVWNLVDLQAENKRQQAPSATVSLQACLFVKLAKDINWNTYSLVPFETLRSIPICCSVRISILWFMSNLERTSTGEMNSAVILGMT
jgi:hypothetical protein